MRAVRMSLGVSFLLSAGGLLLHAAPAEPRLDDLLERARRSPADAIDVAVEARSARWFKEMNAGRALVVNTIGIGDSGDLLRRLAIENRGTYTSMSGEGAGG